MDAAESPRMIQPPSWQTLAGQPRRIGIEIEFSNISAAQAAEIVHNRYGGKIVARDPHDYRVLGSRLGDFKAELDTQYAHPAIADRLGDGAAVAEGLGESLERAVARALGDIGSLWLPVEIVSPPVPLSALPDIDSLVSDLRTAGAEGTDQGLLFAFSTQLNVEPPSCELPVILDHFKAFLLLSEWLRLEIKPDNMRRLLPFADPFPGDYVRMVLDPGYDPGLVRFINDYIEANPTRNRELDLLPLLSELDPARVHRLLDDVLIKARPTFHYRLPDTRLSDPQWGLVTEWNRWVRVEYLAANSDALRQAANAYFARDAGASSGSWFDQVMRLFD